MRVNDEFATINVSGQLDDPFSVHQHWGKLLRARKWYPEIFIDGIFTMLAPTHDSVFMYQRVAKDGRKAVIITNFKEKEVMVDLVAEGLVEAGTASVAIVLDNLAHVEGEKAPWGPSRNLCGGNLRLTEFEAVVLILDS